MLCFLFDGFHDRDIDFIVCVEFVVEVQVGFGFVGEVDRFVWEYEGFQILEIRFFAISKKSNLGSLILYFVFWILENDSISYLFTYKTWFLLLYTIDSLFKPINIERSSVFLRIWEFKESKTYFNFDSFDSFEKDRVFGKNHGFEFETNVVKQIVPIFGFKVL